MPGKAKKRRPQYKNKARRPQTAQTVQSAAAVPGAAVAAPAAVKVPTAAKTAAYAPASTAEYPFFSSELKRIAIITGIILVILIVLAFIIK